jgi:hypothetical protein
MQTIKDKCPNIDVKITDGRVVVTDKNPPPPPTPTATTTRPPPPKPRYYCVDTKAFVDDPVKQCLCVDGGKVVHQFGNAYTCVGTNGTNGTNGKSVTVTDNPDGSVTITDGDGKTHVIHNGKDAEQVTGCTQKVSEDGSSSTVTCGGTTFVLRNPKDGNDGAPGKDGVTGSSGLELRGGVFMSGGAQGQQVGNWIGALLYGRATPHFYVIGAIDLQYSYVAPRTGNMAYIWPQAGGRFYFGDNTSRHSYEMGEKYTVPANASLLDYLSLDLMIGLRQGVNAWFGANPVINGRRYLNSEFWGWSVTASATLNYRVAKWLSFNVGGFVGEGERLTVADCPPPNASVLPASSSSFTYGGSLGVAFTF